MWVSVTILINVGIIIPPNDTSLITHKRDNALVVGGSLRPFADNPCKRKEDFSFFLFYRENERKKNTSPPRPICTLPEWVVEGD